MLFSVGDRNGYSAALGDRNGYSAALAAAVPYPGKATQISRKGQ